MQVEPIDLCYSQPSLYRLCDKVICIPWEEKCPCKADTEFRCSLGNCIPLELKCDGYKQCLYGEDEELCPLGNNTEVTEIPSVVVTKSFSSVSSASEEGLSIPVVVTIAFVGVFVCVLMVMLMCIFIARRQKNNTSRESQSATEPLRKSYITADVEAADSSRPTTEASKEQTYKSRKLERGHFLPVIFDGHYQIHNSDKSYENEAHKSEDTENIRDKDRKNLAINPGAEIYDIDPSNNSRVNGLGKYTFKPRLKYMYMKSKPYHEIEEKDREKLYVMNSYKHCSGKSILPSTLTFDKEPEKFSDKFATDLLCASTPRQPGKHLARNGVSRSLGSIIAQSDIEVT